jgi:hypothetical protein
MTGLNNANGPGLYSASWRRRQKTNWLAKARRRKHMGRLRERSGPIGVLFIPCGALMTGRTVPPLRTDPAAASAFLQTLEPGGWFGLIEMNAAGPCAYHRVKADDVAKIATIIHAANRDNKHNLYVCGNEVRPDFKAVKPTDADIVSIRAIWADVDAKNADPTSQAHVAQTLASWQRDEPEIPRPTTIVQSGDSGGVQAWYTLRQPVPCMPGDMLMEKARDAGKELRTRVRGDAVFAPSHVMRLPGSINFPSAKKRADGRKPFVVTSVFSGGPRFTMRELEARFPARDSFKATGSASTGERGKLVKALQEQGAFDFASLTEWSAKAGDAGARLTMARLNNAFLDDMLERGPEAIAARALRDGRTADASGSGLLIHVACELAKSGLFRDDAEIAAVCELSEHGGAEKPNHRSELAGAVIAAREHVRTFGEAFVPGAAPGWIDLGSFLRPARMPNAFGDVPTGRRFTFETAAEAREAYAPRSWIVKHVIPAAGTVLWFGPSMAKKTFAAIDLGFHLSEGLDWFGLRSQHVGVAMWAGEGVPGLRGRLRGWLDAHPNCRGNGFAAFSDALNIYTESEHALIQRFRALKDDFAQRCKLALRVAVVDTASKAAQGADDNASKDVTTIMRKLERVGQHCGIVFILVHHTGKDESRGARGSSVWLANADGVVEFVKGAFVCRKAKDGPGGVGFRFGTKAVPLGVDEFGDRDTTLVIVPGDPLRADDAKPTLRLSSGAQAALDALTTACAASGGQAVAFTAVAAAAQGLQPDKPVDADTLRATLRRLQVQGIVEKSGKRREFRFAPVGRKEPYIRPELDADV